MATEIRIYRRALDEAIALLDALPDLEICSALKQCASDNGIANGDDLGAFVNWAERQMGLQWMDGRDPMGDHHGRNK